MATLNLRGASTSLTLGHNGGTVRLTQNPGRVALQLVVGSGAKGDIGPKGDPGPAGPALPADQIATLSASFEQLPKATDAVSYLSKSTAANDTNNGLSWGSAKATLQAAYNALPATGGRIEVAAGTFALPSSAIGFNIVPGKPVHIRGLGNFLTEFTYSGTGVAIQVGTGRTVTDLVTTNASTTVTSATAAFTSADVGRTIYTPEGALLADTSITSVTNATTAVVSAAAIATGSGQTGHVTSPSANWGSLRDFQVTTTAFTSQTGVKLYDAHGGDVDIRALGNSYSTGSRGIWAVNCFTNYMRRAVVQNFDIGVDLDGGCHDSSLDNVNIGAKTVCVRVKNSSDVRLRGGQYSSTGTANGGIGVMALCTQAGSSDGGCDGLLIDQIHFEQNGFGLDVAIGRVADGSTLKVRNPRIDGKLTNGGTIDRATNPVVERLTLGFNSQFTVTANCTGLRYVGYVSNNGTITDSGVNSTKDADLLTIRNGGRLGVDLLSFPTGTTQGDWSTLTIDSACYYNAFRSNATGAAVNDRATFDVYLTAGTYAADVFYKKGPDAGDVQLALSGVAFPGLVSGFAASPVAGFITLQPCVVASSGRQSLSLQVTQKNGGSTGFVARLSHIILRRTA